jgi:hypothetical protein
MAAAGAALISNDGLKKPGSNELIVWIKSGEGDWE